MLIEKAFERFAEKHQVKPVKGTAPDGETKIAGFLMMTARGNYSSTALFLEEDNMFIYFVNLGKSKLSDEITIAEVNKMNNENKIHTTLIDSESNEILVKIAQYILGTEEEQVALIERAVLSCGMVVQDNVERYGLAKK